MGSVQLLENGNYLIYTYGNGLDDPECSIIEVTQNQEIVWKATSQNNYSAWYRAYKFPSIHPDAFSVIANNYTLVENEPAIQMTDASLDFFIYNESGFSQEYKYILSDLMDGGPQMFNYSEGNFILGPHETMDISFIMSESDLSSTIINFIVWPTHHEYAAKDIIFSVFSPTALLGDINQDDIYNVLDVVLMVNIILGLSDSTNNADINGDNSIDILDVVLLINIILEV